MQAIATVSLFVNVAAFAPVSPARIARLQMTAAPPGNYILFNHNNHNIARANSNYYQVVIPFRHPQYRTSLLLISRYASYELLSPSCDFSYFIRIQAYG